MCSVHGARCIGTTWKISPVRSLARKRQISKIKYEIVAKVVTAFIPIWFRMCMFGAMTEFVGWSCALLLPSTCGRVALVRHYNLTTTVRCDKRPTNAYYQVMDPAIRMYAMAVWQVSLRHWHLTSKLAREKRNELEQYCSKVAADEMDAKCGGRASRRSVRIERKRRTKCRICFCCETEIK